MNLVPTRGSKIFGNGQEQQHLKLCLLKASHEQVINSTMWPRNRQLKFDPLGAILAQLFLKFTNFTFACLVKTKVSRS